MSPLLADPLYNGPGVGHAIALASVTAVLLAVAILAFRRRDAGV